MGFMGIDLQKRIYTIRLRKSISVQRSAPLNIIPKTRKTFKSETSSSSYRLSNLISFMLSISFVFILLYISSDFLEHSELTNKQKTERVNSLNNKAFSFLKKSGIRRLNQNNIIGAYSEFKLAYNIKPQNQEMFDLLLETTYLLCEGNNTYCKEMDILIQGN